MKQKPGSFTISLDFELYWGMRDKVTLDAYRENLLGVWSAVPKMLSLFEQEQIHVTWATVGFLWYKDVASLTAAYPEVIPVYEDRHLCPYHYLESIRQEASASASPNGSFVNNVFSGLKPPVPGRVLEDESDAVNKMHFAKKLIEQIKNIPFQEIATHTFSHYYTREPVISAEAFEADLKQAIAIGHQNDVEMHSLVFPRNQIDKASLIQLKNVGIKTYRGNPEHWAYREGEIEKTFLQRVYRFIDIYINLSGSHITVPKVDKQELIELKSSIFMRAYSKKFKFLEGLKLLRVKNAMTEAAQKGENFHLWWHPHNFGINQEENMANLEEILQHFSDLKQEYGMVSLTMQELGEFYG